MTENQEVEKKMMSIVAEDGSVEEVEVILAFEFKDTKKEYVIYTKNEKDDNDNIMITKEKSRQRIDGVASLMDAYVVFVNKRSEYLNYINEEV